MGKGGCFGKQNMQCWGWCRGEGCAHWGDLGATRLKKLQLINPSQLIRASQSGLLCSPAALPWGELPEPITGHCSPRSAPWRTQGFPGESLQEDSQAWGLDPDCPEQYLQVSHEDKEVV